MVTRDQNKRTKFKRALKSLFFVTLSILFLVFYFHEQTTEFVKGRTTITTRSEVVDHYDTPVLALCLQPSNNLTILDLDLDSDFTENANQAFSQFFESGSYKLNGDIQIEFGRSRQISNESYILSQGYNTVFGNYHVNLTTIQTMIHGTCYLLESDWKPTPKDAFRVTIR